MTSPRTQRDRGRTLRHSLHPRAGAFVSAVVVSAAVLGPGCPTPPQPPSLSPADSLSIIEENRLHRASVDSFFVYDAGSPFKRDTSIAYTGIRWYPIDPRYRVRSVIHRYDTPDTVDVFGTRGERRRQLRYGYFEFTLPDSHGVPATVRLNVYRFTPYDGTRYLLFRDHLSVWFTDPTTGGETYHVGRYVDVGVEQPDPDHLYTIDFNKAYNPYCAYSSLYSCAIPRDEDRIPVPVRAGELTYHI